MKFNEEQRPLPFVVGETHFALKAYMDQRMKELDSPLRAPEGKLLRILCLGPKEGMTFNDLQKKCRVQKATLSETLSNLNERRLITYSLDSADKRKKLFSATDEGFAVSKQNRILIEKVASEMEEGLTEEEKVLLRSICLKLRKNVGEQE